MPLSLVRAPAGAVPTSDEPIVQLGNSEQALSIGWVGAESPPCLLVGTGFRWVRLYDLRDRDTANGSAVLSCYAHAKAVCGVCVDPYEPYRFVTHSEDADGLIKGWDVRKLRDNAPLFTIATSERSGTGTPDGGNSRSAPRAAAGIAHIGWSPTRRGVLSTIVDGSHTLCLWEVNHAVARQLESQSTAELSHADPTSLYTPSSMPKGGNIASAPARLTACDSSYQCEAVASAAVNAD